MEGWGFGFTKMCEMFMRTNQKYSLLCYHGEQFQRSQRQIPRFRNYSTDRGLFFCNISYYICPLVHTLDHTLDYFTISFFLPFIGDYNFPKTNITRLKLNQE